MSNIAMQGGATGTGTVTLLAPPTNSTQVLTLPDNTGTVVSTASTGVVSPAMLNGNQSGSAPIYGCRAWCFFDGTVTGTNAPAAGGNVTSVTRNGVGDYTINFTVAMPDVNYASTCNGRFGTATNGAGAYENAFNVLRTTTQLRVLSASGGAPSDNVVYSVSIFR